MRRGKKTGNDKNDKKQDKKKPGFLRRLFNHSVKESTENAKEIRDEIILPSVKLGKNRFVSTFVGAKTGFIMGAITTFGPGAIPSAIIGGILGLAAGPEAMKRLENLIKPKDKANDNQDTLPLEQNLPENKPGPGDPKP